MTQEAVVGFGDAALDCKTWTSQVSGFSFEIQAKYKLCNLCATLQISFLLGKKPEVTPPPPQQFSSAAFGVRFPPCANAAEAS